MAASTMSYPSMSAPTISSPPSPALAKDPSPAPPSSGTKSDLDSAAATPDHSTTASPSVPKSALDSPAAMLDQSHSSPPSDPKSDLASVPDTAAAVDHPSSSVASVAATVEESNQALGNEGAEVEEDEEEQEECGFCIFMKSGGCKESFIAWEDCVESAEKSGENIVNKCHQITSILRKCMEEHADYYEPILRAEEAMLNAVGTELESEVERVADATVEFEVPDTEQKN